MKVLARVTWVAGVAALLVLVAGSTVAFGRVRLTTLPSRERVEIQLDNLNATLVEEERLVPLLKSTSETGNNMIDFSWSNTQIDKNTIRFRPLAILSGSGMFSTSSGWDIGGGTS